MRGCRSQCGKDSGQFTAAVAQDLQPGRHAVGTVIDSEVRRRLKATTSIQAHIRHIRRRFKGLQGRSDFRHFSIAAARGGELKSSAPLASLSTRTTHSRHSLHSHHSPLALWAKGMSGTGKLASSGTDGTNGITVGASGTSRTVGASGTSGSAVKIPKP